MFLRLQPPPFPLSVPSMEHQLHAHGIMVLRGSAHNSIMCALQQLSRHSQALSQLPSRDVPTVLSTIKTQACTVETCCCLAIWYSITLKTGLAKHNKSLSAPG